MPTSISCFRTARVTLAALITACAMLALYQYAASPGHGVTIPAIPAQAGKTPAAHKTLPPI